MRSTLEPLLERDGASSARQRADAGGRRLAHRRGDRRRRRLSRAARARPVRARRCSTPASPERLLFVAPNLARGRARARGRRGTTSSRGSAFHEVTHAVQFTARPVAARAPRRPAARAAGDRRREGRRDALVRILARRPAGARRAGPRRRARHRSSPGPERMAIIDRVQATMAVVEGHAEHVDGRGRARTRWTTSTSCARRSTAAASPSRPPCGLLEQLLGLEMKMRQYLLGKRVLRRGRRARRDRGAQQASGRGPRTSRRCTRSSCRSRGSAVACSCTLVTGVPDATNACSVVPSVLNLELSNLREDEHG